MSVTLDRHLRELERAALAGDHEAAVRWLVERVRVGQLPEERLRLAAHLEHPLAVAAAREALNVAPKRRRLDSWIRMVGFPRLADWGRELPGWTELVQPVCVRAATVASELALPHWSSPRAFEDGEIDAHDLAYLQDVIRLARAWIDEPTEANARRMGSRSMGAWDGIAGAVGLELASTVCQPVAPGATSPHSRVQHTARSAAQVVKEAADTLREEGASEDALRDAIRAETIPWLLGAALS